MKISNIKLEYANGFKVDVYDFELQKNKINILIGDNGSGKSSLLKAIILQDTSFSKNMLVQHPYIFQGSVLDNLKLIKQISSSKIELNKIIKALELEVILNDRARNLSGGQRQRLAFGMCLLSDSEVIILDEPFNNIDTHSQKLMQALILAENRTYLIVSHRLNWVTKHGDYFYLIDKGSIKFKGNNEQFINSNDSILVNIKEME